MLSYFIAGLFLICSALAAGTIFILGKIRKQYQFGFLSALLFLLVFHYMFGFYSLWGQFIIVYMVKPYLNPELINRISEIAILLGSPFIVFAWLMLIRFSRELAGKNISNLFITLFLSLHAIFILSARIFRTKTLKVRVNFSPDFFLILFPNNCEKRIEKCDNSWSLK